MDQLHRSGMLDEQEHASFAEIVEKLLRRLARNGAVWHVPRPRDVRALPPARPCSMLTPCCSAMLHAHTPCHEPGAGCSCAGGWHGAAGQRASRRGCHMRPEPGVHCASSGPPNPTSCLQVLKQVPFLQGSPLFEQVCSQGKLLRFQPGAMHSSPLSSAAAATCWLRTALVQGASQGPWQLTCPVLHMSTRPVLQGRSSGTRLTCRRSTEWGACPARAAASTSSQPAWCAGASLRPQTSAR